ncbi:MAG: TetR/AcrR family transcriptional regulator [Actinomycetota bacterium]|nr:TetR/AcrR family transcriptional regulator [Actinomycetota bacterium]
MSEMLDFRQEGGRANQRSRTRDAILHAGASLLRQGATPTVVEAAAAARVSQATAYRYFPTQDSLLSAVVDAEMRSALDVLDETLEPAGNAEEDILQLAEAIFEEIFIREPEHRSLLRLALDHWFLQHTGKEADGAVDRGGRISFIVDALEPLRARIGEASLFRLAEALSLAIGIESHLVLRDVWMLPKAQALDVISWTCRALIRQALAESGKGKLSVAPAAKKALVRSRRRRAQNRT